MRHLPARHLPAQRQQLRSGGARPRHLRLPVAALLAVQAALGIRGRRSAHAHARRILALADRPLEPQDGSFRLRRSQSAPLPDTGRLAPHVDVGPDGSGRRVSRSARLGRRVHRPKPRALSAVVHARPLDDRAPLGAGRTGACARARELFGDRAGVLAALFWACEPNLIAHGSLATTDMGAAPAALRICALFGMAIRAFIQAGDADCSAAAFSGLAQWPSSRCRRPDPIAVLLFVLVALFDLPAKPGNSAPRGSMADPERLPGLLKISAMWIAAFARERGGLERGLSLSRFLRDGGQLSVSERRAQTDCRPLADVVAAARAAAPRLRRWARPPAADHGAETPGLPGRPAGAKGASPVIMLGRCSTGRRNCACSFWICWCCCGW